MIHISGLGVAGSYFYRRLNDGGFDVSGFDPRREDYYLPCGYATNEFLLSEYLGKVGLDSDDYVISRAKEVTFSGHNFGEVSFNSRGMCTIDKKKMEYDLVSGIKMEKKSSGADIRIDATGISRALLGKHPEDYTMYAKEYLTAKAGHRDFYFYFFQKGRGYFWEFPLGEEFHVGAGSDSLNIIDEKLSGYEADRITGRLIRLTPLFDEVSKENIIGIGESVGTVSPISGEGIIPSIKSAECLFQAITRHTEIESIVHTYRESLEKSLGHYRKLRELVSKIQSGTPLRLSDAGTARVAKKDLEMFGVDFKISRVIRHFL